MNNDVDNTKLILEEKKAVNLFLWLFYILFVTYDIIYYYIFPLAEGKKQGIPEGGLGFWIYIIIFSLLPAGIYLYKKGSPYKIKYLFFIAYTIIDTINSILIYWGSSSPFRSGNVVELFFILFAPLFINKKYFYLVSIGTIIKYALFGIIFSESDMIVPTVVLLIFIGIAFVLLIRFSSYVNAITSIYQELRQQEKLAVIGKMAAAIGHEIRNPLASLKGFTQLQEERHPNTNEFYPIMISEIDRLNSIVNDLMDIGKPKTLTIEKANIQEIIAYTLSITQQQAERQGITVETIVEDPLPLIDCDEKQLKQVFINLLKNAIEAMPDGGKITITVKVSAGKELLTSIQDEGCGIPEECLQNLGDPFYTTKSEGTGLGLMVTNQIIKDHNGQLKIESCVGKGTKVNIMLPIKSI